MRLHTNSHIAASRARFVRLICSEDHSAYTPNLARPLPMRTRALLRQSWTAAEEEEEREAGVRVVAEAVVAGVVVDVNSNINNSNSLSRRSRQVRLKLDLQTHIRNNNADQRLHKLHMLRELEQLPSLCRCLDRNVERSLGSSSNNHLVDGPSNNWLPVLQLTPAAKFSNSSQKRQRNRRTSTKPRQTHRLMAQWVPFAVSLTRCRVLVPGQRPYSRNRKQRRKSC